jgi:hypothetical protein
VERRGDADLDKLVAALLDTKDNGLPSENEFKRPPFGQHPFEDPQKVTRACESKWTRLKDGFKAAKFHWNLSGFG